MVENSTKMKQTIAKDILFGTAVGDALGVPVEFFSRALISKNPVTDMMGYGTHSQPTGTWSDDSSLTFCLADSLCNGYDLKDIANKFVRWYDDGLWTPHGEVFDIGNTTSNAIRNLKNGVEQVMAGEASETSNGNGSLMRILPLLTYIYDQPIEERLIYIQQVSSLTHRHPRSILACILLMEFARNLQDQNPKKSLWYLSVNLKYELEKYPHLQQEMHHFKRIFDGRTVEDYQEKVASGHESEKEYNFDDFLPSIASAKVDEIKSGGYVVDTLEASIWCLINSNSFEEAVLMAVNLGSDTDTTGAVTGALAAMHYGYKAIPQKWIDQLVKKDDIEALANRLEDYYNEKFFPHKCPICGTPLGEYPTYPNYVCEDCVSIAADINGQKLEFHEQEVRGGYVVKSATLKKEYPNHECYIKGIKCRYDEPEYGDFVIQKVVE